MTNFFFTLSFILGSILTTIGQNNIPQIVLNHFLVIVDSITYEDILKSKIFNSNFAYSREKKLNGYKGIYLIGEDNYIEIFNPNSIQNEIHKPGESWICHTSMKVNILENLYATKKMFNYSTSEDFDELSLFLQDSINLFTTWEMNKNHYEKWSKKTFSDSVNFLSVDYNSPAESDSSRNYLFSNVAGVRISIDKSDSLDVIQYMTLIGYSKTITEKNKIRFSNSKDFVEIVFRNENEIPRITGIFMTLNNNSNKFERLQIGISELLISGNFAVWELENAK